MQEQSLPSIKEMYNCDRENRDYSVIRNYVGDKKNFAVSTKPTKKSHYLDYEIKKNVSPGPANKSNTICQWAPQTKVNLKRSDRVTYLAEIQKSELKKGSPSPNKYHPEMKWPLKKDQNKHVSDKINFADTCEYESDQVPGPGNYNIRTHISKQINSKKTEPHKPLVERKNSAADVGSYSPCPVAFNTFARYELEKKSSTNNMKKISSEKTFKPSKENMGPGPGAYTTINTWIGKQSLKKNEKSYFRFISKGSNLHIYN